MIKVDNKRFLRYFEKDTDTLLKNFYSCDNILNAGNKGHGVKSIRFYSNDGNPSGSFVSFCENIWNEIIINIVTNDVPLITDAFLEIKNTAKNYSSIIIGAKSSDLFNSGLFKSFFTNTRKSKDEYGVYACFSKDNIPVISYPAHINIKIITHLKKPEFSEYDDKQWDGLSSQIKFGKDNDLLFVLYDANTPCGYLLANSNYKNIYDVSNIFVCKSHRGNNYGMYLTVCFANYCYNNELLPHYGTAVSKYSERVALKSGFEETNRTHYAHVKTIP